MKFVPLDVVKKAIEVFENRRMADEAFWHEHSDGGIMNLAAFGKALDGDSDSAKEYREADEKVDKLLNDLSDDDVRFITGLYLLGREVLEGERTVDSINADSIAEAYDYFNDGDKFLRSYIGGKNIFDEAVVPILPQYAKVLADG